ncbi:MAG TPA: von Willebrand factor type A domain-containing protein [Thermoanaerobaculia bacterium]
MKGLAAILSGFLLLVTACRSVQKTPEHALPLTGSAQVSGLVQAKDGNPVPGATVLLVAKDGALRTFVTDSTGSYHFTSVPAGDYTVKFELAGFGVSTRRVTVNAGGRFNIIGTLNPAAAESITVTAEAPMLNEPGTFRMAAPAPPRVFAKTADITNAASPIPNVEPPRALADQYAAITEHDFVDAQKEATTTFAIDVDRASYANVRRMLSRNQLPPPDAVRLEEMVNYFTYSYPQPSSSDPFSITAEVSGCPWDPTHRLMRIGIQGRNLDEWKMAPNNLVFLLDVSGSMMPPDRLPLIQSAFRLLVDKLRAQDTVSIVVYAGQAGLVLPPTSGADKATILDALGKLQAGGSTAGGAGIELAYKVAKENFKTDGNNRVILATDGDFNVGLSSVEDLGRFIEEKRKTGVFLTTIGVGDDNYRDSVLEMLADKGNGNYDYLDSMNEAKKVFERELTGTLVTIAKDVKVQIAFDSSRVASYRQLGYEDRALANKDFEDDTKDAGELGAGHSVTALYEIVPIANASKGEIASIKLRYKEPNGETSKLVASSAIDTGTSAYAASADLQFAAAVAEFAMLLRKSPHKGTSSYADVAALARASRGVDLDGTREEMLRLVETSRALSGEAGTIARK